MSRSIPIAYVTAVWDKNPAIAKMQATTYCRALAEEGYLPLCPVLIFDGIFREDNGDARRRKRELGKEILKRARFLVLCGSGMNDEMKDDISTARRSKLIVTTLYGVLGCER